MESDETLNAPRPRRVRAAGTAPETPSIPAQNRAGDGVARSLLHRDLDDAGEIHLVRGYD